MDVNWTIMVFVIIDDMMVNYEHQSDCRSEVSDSKILTIAVCVVKFCHNQSLLG